MHDLFQLEVARQLADERAARAGRARTARPTARRPLARVWRSE